MKWLGRSTKGVNPTFLNKVTAAAQAMGATKIYVYSGRRTKATNTGVPNSNHLYGHALDGKAWVPGTGWVQLGTLLKQNAANFGLRSGDQPGFYKGGPDTEHVDDGFNVNGNKPLPVSGDYSQQTPPQTQTQAPLPVSSQPDGTTQTTSAQGEDVSAQLASAIGSIDQVQTGPPLAHPPLVGEGGPNAPLTPLSLGNTWQLIASNGQVSQDTIRLAQLASYGGNGGSSNG